MILDSELFTKKINNKLIKELNIKPEKLKLARRKHMWYSTGYKWKKEISQPDYICSIIKTNWQV